MTEPTSAGNHPPGGVRLRGSAAILAHLDEIYGPNGLPVGSVVAIAMTADGTALGQGRLRGLPRDMDPFKQVGVIQAVVDPLLADPRGARTESVLLCVVRGGDDGAQETDAGWWSALSRVCRERDLLPTDVISRTGTGWHTLQAGTSGAAA